VAGSSKKDFMALAKKEEGKNEHDDKQRDSKPTDFRLDGKLTGKSFPSQAHLCVISKQPF